MKISIIRYRKCKLALPVLAFMPPLADGILGTGAVPIWMSEFLGGSGLGDLGRFEHCLLKVILRG